VSETAGALTREIADAGVGVGRLIWYDPRWPEGFTPTAAGFLRSFLGPLFALPFALLSAAMLANGDEAPVSKVLWASGIAHVAAAVAFPALIAAIVRPLKIEAGYAGFIIIVNWASLFLNAAAGAASLLILTGETGEGLFLALSLMLFGVSLFVTWRASRETLSPEIPIALLMVVLSVATEELVNQVIRFAFGVPAFG
jgi:hypothetical protein